VGIQANLLPHLARAYVSSVYELEENFVSSIPAIVAKQKEPGTQLVDMAQNLMAVFEQKSKSILEGLKEEVNSLVALRKSESEYQSDIDNVYVAALQAKCTYFEELAKKQCEKVRTLEKQLEEKVLPGGGSKDLQAMNDTLRSENIKAMAKLSALEEKCDKNREENSRLAKENSSLKQEINHVRQLFEKVARDTKRDRSLSPPSSGGGKRRKQENIGSQADPSKSFFEDRQGTAAKNMQNAPSSTGNHNPDPLSNTWEDIKTAKDVSTYASLRE